MSTILLLDDVVPNHLIIKPQIARHDTIQLKLMASVIIMNLGRAGIYMSRLNNKLGYTDGDMSL